jgi:GT2 family glycosyltransferase
MENSNIEKVSIILVNYNGWQDTIECLESILRSDYSNYQIIVVDNNSPNNSMEYIKAWAEGKQENLLPDPSHLLYHLSHPAIKKPIPYIYYTHEEAEKGGDKYLEKTITEKWQEEINNREKDELISSTSIYPLIFIQAGANLGFAAGNNVGIKYALKNSDLQNILLINNDTVIDKGTISELISARNKLGENAIYGGRIYYYSEPSKIWYDGGHLNKFTGRTVHINSGRKNICITQPIQVNFITFCYVLIPANIVKKVGLLDESYFMYVEDLDYCYRVDKGNYKLYHVPSSQLWHKIGASYGSEISEFSSYWYYRNTIKFILKRFGKIKKITAILFIITKFPILLLTWLLRNPKIIKSMFRGYIDGFNK